jgi:predicted dehydrogenase
VENVREQKPPSVTCADGVAALQASAAATLSFKENRPVELKAKD